MSRQDWNVGTARAQWRHLDYEAREPEIEVRTQANVVTPAAPAAVPDAAAPRQRSEPPT